MAAAPRDLYNPVTTATSLDRLRSALKFTLWTWAAYWPGGGLILLQGGLDPVSIAVTFSSLLVFIGILMGGALRSESMRTKKEFFIERPIYLLAALALFIVVSSSFEAAENVGLLVFATFYVGGIVLAVVRLLGHLQETNQGIWTSRADQVLLLLVLTGFFASMVFLDALLPTVGGDTLGTAAVVVALGSWVNLLYPVLLLYAARPFREPLSWAYLGRRVRAPVIDFSGKVPVATTTPAASLAPATIPAPTKKPKTAFRAS